MSRSKAFVPQLPWYSSERLSSRTIRKIPRERRQPVIVKPVMKMSSDPNSLTKLEESAEKGDVKQFLHGVQKRLYGDAESCWILESTLRIFQETKPGLFGSSESDELSAAYRETVAISRGEMFGEIARQAATPGVEKLASEARSKGDASAENELYKHAYHIKCLLRS